jgi:hypothetical protein
MEFIPLISACDLVSIQRSIAINLGSRRNGSNRGSIFSCNNTGWSKIVPDREAIGQHLWRRILFRLRLNRALVMDHAWGYSSLQEA